MPGQQYRQIRLDSARNRLHRLSAPRCASRNRRRILEVEAIASTVKAVGHYQPKPQVVVPIIWVVPVAVGGAYVVGVVVPGTATHHATS